MYIEYPSHPRSDLKIGFGIIEPLAKHFNRFSTGKWFNWVRGWLPYFVEMPRVMLFILAQLAIRLLCGIRLLKSHYNVWEVGSCSIDVVSSEFTTFYLVEGILLCIHWGYYGGISSKLFQESLLQGLVNRFCL